MYGRFGLPVRHYDRDGGRMSTVCIYTYVQVKSVATLRTWLVKVKMQRLGMHRDI